MREILENLYVWGNHLTQGDRAILQSLRPPQEYPEWRCAIDHGAGEIEP